MNINENNTRKKRSDLGYNLNLKKGKEIEAWAFNKYYDIIVKELDLQGSYTLELESGTEADMKAGHDIIVNDNGDKYAVGFRYRSKDYGSFTTNNHYYDEWSELKKWEQSHTYNGIQLRYHIQVSKISSQACTVRTIETECFAQFVKDALEDGIDEYYLDELKAMEWVDDITLDCGCVDYDYYTDNDY